MEYEVVIGMEVHAQLLTESKLFCGCSTKFGAPANTQVCPVCLGLPGVLPVLNRRAIDMVIKTALALNCAVAEFSKFARKNYYYPDLPKNYQISMYDLPIGRDGYVDVVVDGNVRRVRIMRVHVEEEAGKLLHPDPYYSLVDFNRTGIPLMEIVTKPDMRGVDEAISYLMTLRDILRYLGVCSGNMEEGVFRCESNISLRLKGVEEYGVRAELKNLNSFKAVQKGLEFEVGRQLEILRGGRKVVQETRRYNEEKEITEPMRWKEEAQDYRYFPEPDLVPLVIDEKWLARVKETLPELPEERRRRFVSEYGLPEYDAGVLTASKALADFYEAAAKGYRDPKVVSNWCMSEFLRLVNLSGIEIAEVKISPKHLVDMLKLIDAGEISGKIAKVVFEEMFNSGAEPDKIVARRGMKQIVDEEELGRVIERVLAENPKALGEFKGGKEKALVFLVGQVMKATGGRANPGLVNRLLRERLGK